jgi:exosome complex component RRP42
MDAMDKIKGNYLKELMAKGIREDRRGVTDFREIKIIKNILPQAEGSAQVDLGKTRVLAGIKMTVEAPMKDTPNQGNLMVMGELLPLASAEYETGPPSAEAIELARVTDRGIRAAEVVNLEELFIEAEKVWTVFIDLYILNYDGNLFDTATIAAMAALTCTKVPKYEDGKVIRTERTKPLRIDSIVASTTFGKVGGKTLLDLTGSEEAAMSTRLTISTDGKDIRAMQKGLYGSWKKDEVNELMGISLSSHAKLKKQILE